MLSERQLDRPVTSNNKHMAIDARDDNIRRGLHSLNNQRQHSREDSSVSLDSRVSSSFA